MSLGQTEFLNDKSYRKQGEIRYNNDEGRIELYLNLIYDFGSAE